MASTTVVLGGGVGGIVTANTLREKLGIDHRVILIDRTGQHLFTPSLLWVMAGTRRPEQLFRPLRTMARPGVEIMVAEVEEIAPDQRLVKTSRGEVSFDYLVVALGTDMAPQAVPGFEEGVHNFNHPEGASNTFAALPGFSGGHVVVVVAGLPYRCPAAPHEAALLLEDYFRRRGLGSKTKVSIYTPEPMPMPSGGAVAGKAVSQMLAARGIDLHTQMNLERVEPARKELVFKDGRTVSYDLLVGIPPHRSARVVGASPLANSAGWIAVDKQTMRTAFDNVFAIGDVVAITLPSGKPLPKAGIFAHAEGLAVAETIASEVTGSREEHLFDGVGYCWIEAGGGKAGFGAGAFYHEPEPAMDMRAPSRMWHLGKVLFEQYWMGGGVGKDLARVGLNLGAKVLKVPSTL